MPRKTFLKSHCGEIAAADFFTDEVLTLVGLVRYHVLFVIDLESRRVDIVGVIHNPGGLCPGRVVPRRFVEASHGYAVCPRPGAPSASMPSSPTPPSVSDGRSNPASPRSRKRWRSPA